MSEPIVPIVTNVGLSAVFNAQQTGLQLEITHIALGSGQWTPDASATELLAEQERVPIAHGQFTPPNQLSVSALADGPNDYWITEFGIIADGVLLAVWSDQASPIAYKAAGVQTVLTHDLILRAFPPRLHHRFQSHHGSQSHRGVRTGGLCHRHNQGQCPRDPRHARADRVTQPHRRSRSGADIGGHLCR